MCHTQYTMLRCPRCEIPFSPLQIPIPIVCEAARRIIPGGIFGVCGENWGGTRFYSPTPSFFLSSAGYARSAPSTNRPTREETLALSEFETGRGRVLEALRGVVAPVSNKSRTIAIGAYRRALQDYALTVLYDPDELKRGRWRAAPSDGADNPTAKIKNSCALWFEQRKMDEDRRWWVDLSKLAEAVLMHHCARPRVMESAMRDGGRHPPQNLKRRYQQEKVRGDNGAEFKRITVASLLSPPDAGCLARPAKKRTPLPGPGQRPIRSPEASFAKVV
ncbi:hypothetical protein BX600DRAFT_474084 [Xylariales sp. PMI_506]|nr:hypothetical protein BX600DRAFT_474084 [Xylariales sp. PMI_506]